MYPSLEAFVKALEQAGELIRVKQYVDPKWEIAEITDRISKVPAQNKALLFENTGYTMPVLINSMGSYKRMCMALGVENLDDVKDQIETLLKEFSTPKSGLLEQLKMLPQLKGIASWMPKVVRGRGDCQTVVHMDPDVTKIPVLTCWQHDGGPFITLPIIHTKDPNTGTRNVGLYRMQVFNPKLTGMHWHKHKVSAGHFNEYKKLNQRMPIAVAIGGDPVYTYAGTAPLPPNIDEYMLAGFLRKKRVELVKCITQDIEVPADADIIIEGYVDPNDDLIWEGPFGDHTGYYSLADWYPKFHITCITHKKNPIYATTIVGIPPQEDAWIGKATERIFLAPMKMTMIPEIMDMELPIEGVFHNLTIVKIKKEFAGHGQKVMNAMWGAGQMMFNKILVIVDENTDIHNYLQVANAITQHVDPQQDIYISQGPMDVLDHSCSKFAFGGKLCIDATTKLEEEKRTNTIVKNPVTEINTQEIFAKYPEIKIINTTLVDGLQAVVISIEKNRKNHIKELTRELFERQDFQNIKFLLYVEATVNAMDLGDVIWRWANNIDPKRDSIVIDAQDSTTISHIAFDGTKKTKELDDFQREWPNIIVAGDETIEVIDKKWHTLGLGDFIPSPSLKYKSQVYKGNAVVES